MSLKRTALHGAHQRAGARLIDFGGWEMPVQYSGIVDEHRCVRKSGGLFDISHMGEFEVKGTAASGFLNRLLTNDVGRLSVGTAQYTLMCNPEGGTIDDLYLYRLGDAEYLMIVNASRIDADWQWVQAQRELWPGSDSVHLENRSSSLGALAVQGPGVAGVVDQCFKGASSGGARVERVSALGRNQVGRFAFQEGDLWIARTGYTGEDGFEIVGDNERMEPIWNAILAAGHPACLQPCGLGARDTLRTEMGYPLYGHELDETISPVEAGLGFFVAFDKPGFVGREVLARQREVGSPRQALAFVMSEKSPPPRPHYPVAMPDTDGGVIGVVTSGTQSPSLEQGIGLALVERGRAKAGDPVAIEIRGRRYRASVVKKPIYRKPSS